MPGPWAYITGASSGIGRLTAIALARRGYATVLMARRGALLEELAAVLRTWAPSLAVPIDLAEPETASTVVEPVLRQTGPARVLVNCAGFGIYRPALEHSPAELTRLMRVNHFAAFELARLLLPGMLSRRQGHVFSVCSMSSRVGPWGHAGYAASKAAMRSATETLAAEFPARSTGVRFTIVYPGIVRTPYFDLPGMDLLWRRVAHRAIEPARLARAIADGVGRAPLALYVPRHYRLLDALAAASPGLALRMVRNGSRPLDVPEGSAPAVPAVPARPTPATVLGPA